MWDKRRFACELKQASSFDESCTLLLRSIMAILEESLGRPVDVRRVCVRTRPELGSVAGVRGVPRDGSLHWEQWAQARHDCPLWLWMMAQRRAIVLDSTSDEPKAWNCTPDCPCGFNFREEPATMLVLPLKGERGDLRGMAALDVRSDQRCPPSHVLDRCFPSLQHLVDAATPFLLDDPQTELPDLLDTFPVVGRWMRTTASTLQRFARQEQPILLIGPMGVGKLHLAQWCHERSPRGGGAFVWESLRTLPEEGELSDLPPFLPLMAGSGGRGEATSGTVYLSDVEHLSLRAQSRLLKLLRQLQRHPERVTPRLIFGTTRELFPLVQQHAFLEELAYRLGVYPVRVPSLGTRRDEIVLWTKFLLRERFSSLDVMFTPAAETALRAADWPGNLLQLDNVICRAYALAVEDGGGVAVQVDAKHVRDALSYEVWGESRSVWKSLSHAAEAYAREAVRRRESDSGLALELSDAFRGLVLAAAVEVTGSREDAMRLFGKESMIKGRNHYRLFRRVSDRVAELHHALGEDRDAYYVELLRGEQAPLAL